ncbi:HNH endonuclease [Listeria newyorkensis]|uniref:HNH endonuclease n=1 Tax=Listeria newyorkensis TaxID=1497681 RepID=UPI00056AC51E|nr:HNH endonuclease signature motif containing protein [Listeria newyorkensis]SQC57668.1 HNH endonuclease [Listeria newyorkensis]
MRTRDEIDAIYKTSRWAKTRKTVLARDYYLCQECKRRGIIKQGNTVHHIIELREDTSKAFDLNNLETVCLACHNMEHPEKAGGRRKAKRNPNVIKFYRNNDFNI